MQLGYFELWLLFAIYVHLAKLFVCALLSAVTDAKLYL